MGYPWHSPETKDTGWVLTLPPLNLGPEVSLFLWSEFSLWLGLGIGLRSSMWPEYEGLFFFPRNYLYKEGINISFS